MTNRVIPMIVAARRKAMAVVKFSPEEERIVNIAFARFALHLSTAIVADDPYFNSALFREEMWRPA